MSALLGLLFAWSVVFAINVVPAFMPPSWAVMSAFRIAKDLPLLPLTIGGAAMSALGRICLGMLTRRLHHALPRSDRENALALGRVIDRYRHWREVIVFGYCLLPLPTNPLFIAAGISHIPLLRVTLVFFVGRSIADTFWVWTATRVTRDVGALFLHQVVSWKTLAAQATVVALSVLLFRLPWVRWLGSARHARKGHALAPR